MACALFSAAAFILLAALGLHPLGAAANACALLSKYSYAVFLTHHVIILRLVDNFDLAAMTRRDTALLFGVYLWPLPRRRQRSSGWMPGCAAVR